jgi:glycosyltransferase involved in cell wall biosynthesis
MPFVSILTPVYNGVEYLETCVQSVLNQTFTDWELFIGINGHGTNGGSAAAEARRLSALDPRIKVIVQPPPLKGKVESLNDLMKHVTSSWVCLLDCDDKWHPKKLQYQIVALMTEAKDAAVIGTQCEYFDEMTGTPCIPHGYVDPDVLEQYNPIINSSAMIRADLCKWEYNTINNFIEDYYLWTEIALAGHKLYNLPEVLTYHRIHKTSAFNSKNLSDEGIRSRYKHLRSVSKAL